MSLNLHHLEIFHAIAESQSVGRAAERLGISQPAVSKQLKTLEQSLAATLLRRNKKGIQLTEEGLLLAGYAKRIFALSEEAEHALDELRGLQRGKLSVGAGTTIGVYVLPDALVRFRQRFPAIKLDLELAASDRLREMLRERAIDFALTETALPSPELDSDIFWTDELVAIVPPTHKLARGRDIAASKLAQEPFIVRESGSPTGSLVERVMRERKIKVEAVLSLSSTEAVKRAVAAGLGVSIVPKMSIGAELQAKQLHALHLRDIRARRPIYLVRQHGRSDTRAAIAFLCILKHVVRGTLPTFRRSGF